MADSSEPTRFLNRMPTKRPLHLTKADQDDLLKAFSAISAAERSAFERAVRTSTVDLSGLDITLETSSSLTAAALDACFQLIKHTSSAAYKASSWGWSPKDKRAEMREEGMHYLLLQRQASRESDNNGKAGAEGRSDGDGRTLCGFLAYKLTEEDGYLVLYVYEIHLWDEMQGRGLGGFLMGVAGEIAAAVRMDMVMLTVFTSNAGAVRFYERLGFAKWDEEPLVSERKWLRSGTIVMKPSYVILAKEIKPTTPESSSA